MADEFQNHDGGWAMAPPHDIHDRLLTDYKLAIAEIELAHRTIRNTADRSRISDYFNSTNARLGFYYLMLKAAYVNQPYNVTAIAQKLHISRQSATTMVRECLAEDWIEPCCTDSKLYQASNILIDADSQYALLRMKRLHDIGYPQAVERLRAYMELCQTT